MTPADPTLDRAIRALEPVRRLMSPVLLGIERLPPAGPRLFVGNHTLLGVIDAPWFVAELYRRCGVRLFALGDHAHFKIPGWRDFLTRFGVVDGTPASCAALFARGADVLVFPGGAREVAKGKGEQYTLKWGRRAGFARMALEHGVTIVPFAAVGAEDALDVVVGPDEILASPLGAVLRGIGWREDLVPPVVKGIGPTPLPRPERLYFELLEPIPPSAVDAVPEAERAWALREATRAAIEHGLARLRSVREQDPERRLRDRVRRRVLGDPP